MDQIDLLIDILFDKNADLAERDDAAMYLGEYDDDRALAALIKICLDKTEDEFIFAHCGESVGSIWAQRNKFDPIIYSKMVPIARHEVYYYFKSNKPELIEKYKINK